MTTEPRPLHTSGPWIAKRLIDNNGNPYSTLYEAHIDIGPCMIWAPVGNAEQEANAALIARAPELLARVEELEQEYAKLSACYKGENELTDELTVDNARLRSLLQLWVNYFQHSDDDVVGALLRESRKELAP